MAENGHNHNQNLNPDRGQRGRGLVHPEERPLMGRRAFLAGLAATGALLALPGCTPRLGAPTGGETATDAATPASADDMHLRVYIQNPAYIEPYDVSDVAGKMVASALFETLVTYDYEANALRPAAASSWTVNEEGTVFEFELVPTATFHDGTPVNAQSFKRSWERTVSPATDTMAPSSVYTLFAPIAGYQELRDGTADTFAGVTTLGEYSIRVTLSYAYPDFIYTLAHPAFAPVPESAADRSVFAAAPVGNGPFMMDGKWVDEQYISVVRNESFHGLIPEVAGVDFLVFRDESTAYLEFEAGNVDFAAVPAERLPEAQGAYEAAEDGITVDESAKLLTGDEMAVHYLALNCADPAFAKPEFRRALSLAIDRQALVTGLFGDMYAPADGIIPPGMDGYGEGAWLDCTFDLAAAQAAMVEAGYPNGNGAPALTLTTDSTEASRALLARIKDFWSAIGVDTVVKEDSVSQHAQDLTRGDYQVVDFAWMTDGPMRDGIYDALFSSTSNTNFSRYENAEVDAAILAARQELDGAARTSAYDAIDELIAGELPVIPLYFYRHHHVASERVASLVYDPFCNLHAATAEVSE